MFFKNPRDPNNIEVTKAIKQWTKELLHLQEDKVVLFVSEIDCVDPACPGTETHIMIAENEKKPQLLRIQKPLTFVRKRDVEEAVKAIDNADN